MSLDVEATRTLLDGPGFRFVARRGAAPVGLVFLTIACVGVGAVWLLHLDRLPVVLCAFKAITGLPCPTCGSTRVLGRLAVFDLAGAASMNPLASAAGLLLAVWGLADLALLRQGEALIFEAREGVSRILRFAVIAAVIANWAFLIVAGR